MSRLIQIVFCDPAICTHCVPIVQYHEYGLCVYTIHIVEYHLYKPCVHVVQQDLHRLCTSPHQIY